MKQLINPDVVEAAQKTSFGVAGVTYTFLGLPLDQLAAALTAVYMAFQIIILLAPRIKALWQRWRNK